MPNTLSASSILLVLGVSNALVIGGETLENGFVRAAANIPLIDVLPSQGLNVYDAVRRDVLVMTKDAVDFIEERLK